MFMLLSFLTNDIYQSPELKQRMTHSFEHRRKAMTSKVVTNPKVRTQDLAVLAGAVAAPRKNLERHRLEERQVGCLQNPRRASNR